MPVVALPYLKACCLHPANVCGWLLFLKATSECNPVGCGREPHCSCRGEKPAACPRGSSVVGWVIHVDEVRAGRWGPRSSSCASSCCLHHSCSSPSPPLGFTSAFHLALSSLLPLVLSYLLELLMLLNGLGHPACRVTSFFPRHSGPAAALRGG